MEPTPVRVDTEDGVALGAMRFGQADATTAVVVGSATGVPQGFYRRFALHLASAGIAVWTFDYRGIAASAPADLRGYEASMADWGLFDIPAVVRRARVEGAERLVVVGHSVGGQVAGLTPEPDLVSALIGVSAQSGHWRLQGGIQPAVVGFHVHVTLPVLVRVFGYAPWSRFSRGEDLPAGVGRQWAAWSRDGDYLLGDDTLPLARFAAFTAPVLSYSIDDDDWGTARSVDSMMRAYPNVERRHVAPADIGVDALGHMGAFRLGSERLWDEMVEWIDAL